MKMTQEQTIEGAYRADFEDGLKHVIGNLQGGVRDEAINLRVIETGDGNVDWCKRDLGTTATAASVVAWFRDRDLTSFKQWTYVAAKIERIRQQRQAWQIGGSLAGFNLFSSWLWLVSDCEALIEWRTRFEPFIGWTGDQERPNEFDEEDYVGIFVGYQPTLALRGDWPRLAERSERWLAEPSPYLKQFAPDMEFFLALANADVAGMESALGKITSPAERRWRSEWQSGYTNRLFSEEAVVYAKIAWRHGYQVDVDTPYIPKEWLPIAPLPSYTDPYEFMQGFDVNQPLSSAR